MIVIDSGSESEEKDIAPTIAVEPLSEEEQLELGKKAWRFGLEAEEAGKLFYSIVKCHPEIEYDGRIVTELAATRIKKFFKLVFELLVYFVFCKTTGLVESNLSIFKFSKTNVKSVTTAMEQVFKDIKRDHEGAENVYKEICSTIYRQHKGYLKKIFKMRYLMEMDKEGSRLPRQLHTQFKQKISNYGTFDFTDYKHTKNQSECPFCPV